MSDARDTPSPLPDKNAERSPHGALTLRQDDVVKLVAGLAHEIKNPLSTIRLNLELLAEDVAQQEGPHRTRAEKKLSVVQHECQRLQDLLEQFLQFVRVREMRLEPRDLNREVAALIDFFRPQATRAKVELIPYLQSDLPSVLLDREAFRGALFNLVLNAQQAMPEGGQLVFRTRSMIGGVQLDLIDTGLGMDAKTIARVFEAFYSTKPQGTGLGLPMTRRVIDEHGGKIEVHSEPGRGTQVSIFLPTAP